MRFLLRRFLKAAILVLFISSSVHASGFSIFEQGARAMGISGAFAARAADLSAVFHNPAGLAQLYGTHFQSGTTLINLTPEFTHAGTYTQAKTVNQWFYPSTLYAGTRLNDKIFVAFGFMTPFGLGMKWQDDWIGKHIIKEINLETFNFNPMIAYNLTDKINIGIGLQYSFARATLNRYAAFLIPDIAIEGNGHGYGYSAGIQYKADEKWTFGISYRSKMKLGINGDAVFTYAYSDAASLAALQAQYPNGPAGLDITTPQVLCTGVNFMPTEKISAELNINYLGWSSYDELVIAFEDPALGLSVAEKSWNDVYAFRFGVEYYYDETWTLRAGGYYDQSPVDDEYLEPMLPDADRNGITVGVGWKSGKMQVDAAYLHIFVNDRTTSTSAVDFNGSYKNAANLFGLSFSYKLN